MQVFTKYVNKWGYFEITRNENARKQNRVYVA